LESPLIFGASSKASVVSNGWSNPANWLAAVITIVLACGLAYLIRRLILRWAKRTQTVASTVQISAQISAGIIVIIGVVTALAFLGVNLAPIVASLGVAGVAAGFALKDIAENYASGVIMGFSNPFQPGDRVIVSGSQLEGTVEELQLRYTVIRSAEGVRILMPNSQVLKNPIENLSANSVRRTNFDVKIAFDSDIDEVRQVALAVVKKLDHVSSSPSPRAYAVEMGDEWLAFRVDFWHEPTVQDRNLIRGAALAATLAAFEKAGVTMPYTAKDDSDGS
jgi:small-conductance mechanosensitive channel